MNVVLMGMRGCGKSTVGPVLANFLANNLGDRYRFVDLDEHTTRVLGKQSVSEAFASLGEPAFRAGETTALAQCLQSRSQVIALGGGTPTAPGAAELLLGAKASSHASPQGHASARVVYLRASARTLQARLRADPNLHQRPSLTGLHPVLEAPILLEQREPVYIKLADVIVSVEGRTPDEIAHEIASAIATRLR